MHNYNLNLYEELGLKWIEIQRNLLYFKEIDLKALKPFIQTDRLTIDILF